MSKVNLRFIRGVSMEEFLGQDFFIEELINGIIGEAKDHRVKKKLKREIDEIGVFFSNLDNHQDELISKIAVAFSSENMEKMYRTIEENVGYDLNSAIGAKIDDIFGQYDIDTKKAEYFKKNIINMVFIVISENDSQKADRMFWGAQFNKLDKDLENLKSTFENFQRENKTSVKQDEQSEMAVFETTDNVQEDIKWNVQYTHVKGILAPREEQTMEMRSLTEQWEEENKQYPGWFILPIPYRKKLKVYMGGVDELLKLGRAHV